MPSLTPQPPSRRPGTTVVPRRTAVSRGGLRIVLRRNTRSASGDKTAIMKITASSLTPSRRLRPHPHRCDPDGSIPTARPGSRSHRRGHHRRERYLLRPARRGARHPRAPDQRRTGPAIIGDDPFMIRGIRDKLWRFTDYHGAIGLALLRHRRRRSRPLGPRRPRVRANRSGACSAPHRDRVPTYAMVGWLNYDLDELKAHLHRRRPSRASAASR